VRERTFGDGHKIPPKAPRKRDRVFGDGPRVPLENREQVQATADDCAAQGIISQTAERVLRLMIDKCQDKQTGALFPSYETIGDKVGVSRSTVWRCLKQLEASGLLTWVNRLKKTEVWDPVLGRYRCEVHFNSNAYVVKEQEPIPAPPLKPGWRKRCEQLADEPIAATIAKLTELQENPELEGAIARLLAARDQRSSMAESHIQTELQILDIKKEEGQPEEEWLRLYNRVGGLGSPLLE
jgi:Helix-turn-helix domain